MLSGRDEEQGGEQDGQGTSVSVVGSTTVFASVGEGK